MGEIKEPKKEELDCNTYGGCTVEGCKNNMQTKKVKKIVWGNKSNYDLMVEVERIRKQRDQTLKAICFEIGISTSTFNRVYRGHRNCSMSSRIDLIRWLNSQA